MNEPSKPQTDHPTEAEATRATQEMRTHLDRAKDIVERYKTILTDPPQRPHDRRH